MTIWLVVGNSGKNFDNDMKLRRDYTNKMIVRASKLLSVHGEDAARAFDTFV